MIAEADFIVDDSDEAESSSEDSDCGPGERSQGSGKAWWEWADGEDIEEKLRDEVHQKGAF